MFLFLWEEGMITVEAGETGRMVLMMSIVVNGV
jgi:hypothetical protein